MLFPSWVEYSPDKDAKFYFLCIIFNKPFEILRHNAFTIDGFKFFFYKKIRDRKG